MKKLLTVIGTRPQYIKYAALSSLIRRNFIEVLVDTGQHYDHDMSGVFLKGLRIPRPHHNLGITRRSPAAQLSSIITKLTGVIHRLRPDALLCFGDTTSTLAAALAADKNRLTLIHIEAGERNFDRLGRRVAPHGIPEEMNRILTDNLAQVLLCSSQRAVANLRMEGNPGFIAYTGDITYDLYLKSCRPAIAESTIIKDLKLEPGRFYFCTVHRAINTDNRERLKSIFKALAKLKLPVVFPIHPRTKRRCREFGFKERLLGTPNILLHGPVSYSDSLALNHGSKAVITDSGGVVREAYFCGRPSIYLDDTTEWIDIFMGGWSTITGANENLILAASDSLPPGKKPRLFGDGKAVMKTIEVLKDVLRR